MKRLKQFILLFTFHLLFYTHCFAQRKAFEGYYLYTKEYPSIEASPSWGEGGREVQGITHDDNYWYITATEKFYVPKLAQILFLSLNPYLIQYGIYLTTMNNYQNCYLWKIPVSEPLDQDFTNNSKVKQVMLLQFSELSNATTFQGYSHWGDVDYYFHINSKTGYLIIPSTCDSKFLPGPTALVIFRASDLSLVGFGKLPGGKKQEQKDVGWCAVDSAGYVFSSNDDPDINKNTPKEGTSLFKYKVVWDSITKGYNGDISGLITFNDSYTLKGPRLRYSDGTTSTNLSLHNMQGGQFSLSNELLYISNGTGKCKGLPFSSSGAQPNDGIHVIDTKTWTEVERSTNHSREDPNYFDYHYDPGCGILEVDSRSAEGLTIWDLDNGKAPYIRGQLHVLVADVSGVSKNKAGIEHFSGKLQVDQGEKKPATLNEPISGTDQRPFFSISDAFNFYPGWDGAQIVVKNGSYGDIGHYSTRVKISSSGGDAIIGKSNPKIQGVVLYQHPDYKGDYRYFDKDIIDLDAYSINFEHVASSLRLNNIKEVILYAGSGYNGPSITIKADAKSLDAINWNDRVSSLRIIR